LEYLGRIDEQVKVRGYRIEPGEIEAVLMEKEGVKEAAVVGRAEGEGGKRLVGYVVKEAGAEGLSVRELREYLKGRLPEWMVPGVFMFLEQMPRTPNGKTDRRALPEPDKLATISANEFTAPRDIIELRLLEIWENAFNVRPIGITDNFFDLGGHSLLAIRITSDIKREFNIPLPLNLFLQETTIERLARIIRGEAGSLQEMIAVPIQARGSRPPFFCVHPGSGTVFHYAALARHLGLDQPFYGLQDPILYEGGDPNITLEERAARYIEALREIQPHGPYFLGGWSFGGHVAFQMAQYLESKGEEVALLALLDTAAPSHSLMDSADDGELLAVIISELFSYHEGDATSLQQLTDDLRRLGPEAQLSYARAKLREHSITELRNLQVSFFLMLFKSRLKVLREYAAQRYAGQITLILASEETTAPDTRELDFDASYATRGWDELSAEPVKVYHVPGKHSTICMEPQVQVLAARLKACLAESQRVTADAGAGERIIDHATPPLSEGKSGAD
jgi:thioesterase domain-containing protein/acyl carrier protein